jgi:hypothetical protein
MRNSLLCFALVGAYVPQCIAIAYQGTFGISSWMILITTLFSTTQLASLMVNIFAKVSFTCVNSGELRGWQAFSALLGFIQIAVQCICVLSV